MMLSRMVAVSLFALSADYAAALVGSGVLVHGLRRHAAAGPYRPARTTSGDGTSFLRMSGEAEDKDGVMHRVDARLQVEPMSLTVAYFEHAYASPPAEIIADLLEAALSSASYIRPEHLGAVVPVLSSLPSSAPCDDPQSPCDSDSHTTRVYHHAGDEDAADTDARKPDRSATSPNAARLDMTADDSETPQDVASVLERTTKMEQDRDPVTKVKGQIQKWSRYGIVLHFVYHTHSVPGIRAAMRFAFCLSKVPGTSQNVAGCNV
jgi:hypothetical protein